MPRMSRIVIPGLPHHVTQRGVRSIAIFDHDGDRELYLSLMEEQAERPTVPGLVSDDEPRASHRDPRARGFVGPGYRGSAPSVHPSQELRGRRARIPLPGALRVVCDGRWTRRTGGPVCGTEPCACWSGDAARRSPLIERSSSSGPTEDRSAEHGSDGCCGRARLARVLTRGSAGGRLGVGRAVD